MTLKNFEDSPGVGDRTADPGLHRAGGLTVLRGSSCQASHYRRTAAAKSVTRMANGSRRQPDRRRRNPRRDVARAANELAEAQRTECEAKRIAAAATEAAEQAGDALDGARLRLEAAHAAEACLARDGRTGWRPASPASRTSRPPAGITEQLAAITLTLPCWPASKSGGRPFSASTHSCRPPTLRWSSSPHRQISTSSSTAVRPHGGRDLDTAGISRRGGGCARCCSSVRIDPVSPR